MPTVTLTPVAASRTTPVVITAASGTAVASGNDYVFANDGNSRLVILNSSSSNTVTIITPNTVDGLSVADRTYTVSSSANVVVGPFPTSVYNNGSGQVTFTVSQNAEVFVIRG